MSPHPSRRRQPPPPPPPGDRPATAPRGKSSTEVRWSLRAGLALASAFAALLAAVLRLASLWRRLQLAEHEAGHDRLTGLPNRRAALTQLATGPVGMIGLLDLDNFKEVNDRHGHDVGDQLLSALGARLVAALGEDGMVARLAGDEFLILWTHRPSDPAREAFLLIAPVLCPVTLHGHTLMPAASLGLALPGPTLSGEALLAAADHAMYEAKQGDSIRLYASPDPPGPINRQTPHRRALRPPYLAEQATTPRSDT